MRLIDKDALMKDLEKWMKQADPTHPQEDNAIPPMEDIIVSTLMTIEEQPTVEPERKTGKWLTSDDMYETGICSVCKWDSQEPVSYTITMFKYCPNCSARMVQEGEDSAD